LIHFYKRAWSTDLIQGLETIAHESNG